ncbi:unnamed protein product [Strongylus vulgaris]|uniref:Endonuclease/exonuclease/phosphatase domain-containing protein n=1 Tax=Strongylus vulgaris TaxID=40348 RepID=A0A3P7IW26_STRVU|nr:unnamed protein product [Strongylus vulgaris]
MGSYHLAWLFFDSVLCIRKPLLSSTATLHHQQLMTRNLMLFEDLEEVIRKENSFYKFVVADFNAKIGMLEEGCIGSGDLEQDSGMRTATVMWGSYLPHDFFMATPSLWRRNTGGGRGSPAVRLMRRSTTFWTSQ